jgi:hypothetical protein
MMVSAVKEKILEAHELAISRIASIAEDYPPVNCGHTSAHHGVRMALRTWQDMLSQLRGYYAPSAEFRTANDVFQAISEDHLARLTCCGVCHARFEGRLDLVKALMEERRIIRDFGPKGL